MFRNIGSGNFLVEMIGVRIGESACPEILVFAYKLLVMGKGFRENLGIEDKPLVAIGDHQMFQLVVARTNAFIQKIQQQFLQRFGIEVIPAGHLGLVGGALRLDQNTDGILVALAIMNHQIVAILGVHEIVGLIVCLPQKGRNEVLVEFLALIGTQRPDQLLQLALEQIHVFPTRLDLEVGLVQCLAGCLYVLLAQ